MRKNLIRQQRQSQEDDNTGGNFALIPNQAQMQREHEMLEIDMIGPEKGQRQ